MPRRLALALIALAVLIAACGDGTADSPTTTQAATSVAPATTAAATTTSSEPASAFPVEVGGVTIPQQPMRIVSGSATHTEILYALGAGDRIVATDTFSDYPPAANATEKIDAFNLNIEAVAAFDPDLVILFYDPGDAVATLQSLGIPTILFDPPIALEDAYDQIAAVGMATGNTDEAAAVVAEMRAGINEILAGIEPGDEPTTFFHEVDATFYSVTSSTFLGSLYGLLGLENIADPADADGFGYPQLTAEYILDADPDFIFLGDVAYGESAATVAARPGWETLSAVVEGRIVELDSDLASRWGPRIVDFLASITESVTRVASS